MRIQKVDINNYRSIDAVTITFEYNPRVLIGINETGKTNILKALSAIDTGFDFNFERDAKLPNDIKYERKTPYIDYYFQLDEKEMEQILEKTFGNDKGQYPFKMAKGKDIKNIMHHLKYRVAFDKTNQRNNTWLYSGLDYDSIEVKTDFFEPVEGAVDNVSFVDGSPIKKLSEITFINKSQIANWDVVQSKLKELTKETIEKALVDEAVELVGEKLPKMYFWQYNPKILLDDPIKIDDFLANPETAPILKNMFILSGIEKANIKTEVDRIKKIPAHFQGLLQRISDTITKHLLKVWPEVGDVEVSIIQTGVNFVIGIQDKVNLYTFGNRSDGFKRFICFLLDLSTRYSNKEIKDSLILLDEPEIGLHPSGVRYLRDELIKISRENDCVIATHSIFMIDSNTLKRHLIIEKENESTEIQEADKKNFVKEELLFEALGASQFQLLKTKNLIFEGWTDYEMFSLLLENIDKDNKTINRDSFGVCWLDGINENKVFPKVAHSFLQNQNF